jgi:hypothetical protein
MSHTHKTRFVAAVKKILDSLPSPIDDTGVRGLSKFLFGSDKKNYLSFLERNVLIDGCIIKSAVSLTYCLLQAGCNKQRVVAMDLSWRKSDARFNVSPYLSAAMIKRFMAFYGEERLIKLITGSILPECCELLYEIDKYIKAAKKALGDISMVDSKHKTLESALCCFEELHEKISLGDFDLEQKEDTLLIDGLDVEGLTVRIPRTHYDLVRIGEVLRFCIGSGEYSRGVKRGLPVIALYKDEKPIFAFQFSPYRVLEAQGFSNTTEVPKSVMKPLQDIFLITPTDASQFLPITDSGWIHGYRYDGQHLYLLLGHRIYAYFDVSLSDYEGLLDSNRKGRYVNTVIKGRYEYLEQKEVREVEIL